MPIDTHISLEDFASAAKDNGCTVEDNDLGTFIGASGARNYPHIHVWRNGTIALSMGHNKNVRVGRLGDITISELGDAHERCVWVEHCALKETIEWVLRSAS
ncbi:MAG TPA: hypothetical protein VM869_15225 [Enhygromyxa sp.]|nr:hypothetical protein [Enhygromyxa sp.]